MLLGYNTNGLAHHDLFDAVELLADIGYRSVAITIDHNAIPPVCTACRSTSCRITNIFTTRNARRNGCAGGCNDITGPMITARVLITSKNGQIASSTSCDITRKTASYL